jgi:hypothetical protein
MAANVLYRAGFAAANLGQHIQYLRLQPDACPAAPDLDTALHKRTAPLRTIISVRHRATCAKAKSKGSHTVTYDQIAAHPAHHISIHPMPSGLRRACVGDAAAST